MSWSKNIFLQINKQVGKNKKVDFIMYFCAHVLIYWLIGLVLSWGAFILYEIDVDKFSLLLKLLLTSIAFVFIFNYLLALLWYHPRPILENSDIKVSLKTLSNWKSFPSDHTAVAFVFVFIPFFLGVNFYFFLFLLFLACLVAFARVYVGVHYPRDILGGFMVALVFSLSSFWLLENVTQVLYDHIKFLFF